MRLVGYIRVSTAEQAEDGVSLANQLSRLRSYCGLMEHELIEVYEDRGKSGKDMKRLGFRAALTALETGSADGLLVTHLDRMSRSVRDVLYLTETYFGPGCDSMLICIDSHVDTSTPTGRASFHILAIIAQMQREEDVERIRRAMAHKKAAGQLVGSVPWGYRLLGDGTTLAPNPKERELMMFALGLKRDGKTLRKIATALKQRGYTNKRGRSTWNPSSVSRVIKAAIEYEGSEEKRWEDEEAALAAEFTTGLMEPAEERG